MNAGEGFLPAVNRVVGTVVGKAVEELSGSQFEEAKPGLDERPIAPGFSPSLALEVEFVETPVVPQPAIDDDDGPASTAFEDDL